ncbi:glycosyltransferase family 87 protein [Luteimicrobium sp. NPDC057192]|uniref:glycosyltransferase family 87 protein n=1 Tax=Luteimicrobium sp. NPDC057192 TaxID=3346042 RepID=UPI003641826A
MRSTRALLPTVLAGGAVILLVAVVAVGTHVHGFAHADRPRALVAIGAGWVAFAVAVLALRRVPERVVVPFVLAGSVAVGLAALTGPPNLSTDSARYAWDGIVQDAGTSPYAHVPTADALEPLRTDWLFPAPAGTDAGGVAVCPAERVDPTTSVPSGEPLCTAINRPHVPTIYPPVAEAWFAAVRTPVPSSAAYWPLQVGGLAVSLAVTGGLLVALRRRDLGVRWAAVWGWCPFVASEAVTNSHVDVLGAALVLAATLASTRPAGVRRALTTGALLGLAAATKLVPAIAGPPLLRRDGWRTAAVAVVTFVLVYVPYVVGAGSGVLGFLPGYLDEEGYDSGNRFALLAFLPGPVATVVAVGLVGALAVACWWRADPDAPWHAQVVLVGGTLLVVGPSNAWYALLLVPLVALSHRWEWLAVPAALAAGELYPRMAVIRPAMGVALVVVLAVTLVRASRPARLPRLTWRPA